MHSRDGLPGDLFSSADALGVLGGGDAKLILELAGEMVDRGILEGGGDLGEVHVVLPDHLLALLELHPADILTGGDLHPLFCRIGEDGDDVGGGQDEQHHSRALKDHTIQNSTVQQNQQTQHHAGDHKAHRHHIAGLLPVDLLEHQVKTNGEENDGAGGRARTGTLSPAADFESASSTNSNTPAGA